MGVEGCIKPIDTLAEKRKPDRGRIPADFVTAVTGNRIGQRKEGTWGTHVVDFCKCAYFPIRWRGVGGLDQYVADGKNLSGLSASKKKKLPPELRLTVLDRRPGRPYKCSSLLREPGSNPAFRLTPTSVYIFRNNNLWQRISFY